MQGAESNYQPLDILSPRLPVAGGYLILVEAVVGYCCAHRLIKRDERQPVCSSRLYYRGCKLAQG